MRVVLDTNILVSGLADSAGTPGRIVSAWREAQFELVVSVPMIAEFRRVVTYARVRSLLARSRFSDRDLDEFVDLICLKAVMVDIGGVTLQTAPRDPKDFAVVATFVASQAEWLVTGDKKDLLTLGLKGVVSAKAFLARMDALRVPPLAEQPRTVYRVSRARRKRTTTTAQV